MSGVRENNFCQMIEFLEDLLYTFSSLHSNRLKMQRQRTEDYMNYEELYEELKERYTELKVILTASGINVTALDKIKE